MNRGSLPSTRTSTTSARPICYGCILASADGPIRSHLPSRHLEILERFEGVVFETDGGKAASS